MAKETEAHRLKGPYRASPWAGQSWEQGPKFPGLTFALSNAPLWWTLLLDSIPTGLTLSLIRSKTCQANSWHLMDHIPVVFCVYMYVDSFCCIIREVPKLDSRRTWHVYWKNMAKYATEIVLLPTFNLSLCYYISAFKTHFTWET